MHTYKAFHFISSIFMMLALLWLTVSIPLMYKAQQNQYQASTQRADDNNPFANTTEEKAPGTINLTEEYLHHTDHHEHPWCSIITHHRDYSSSLYVAWHGEPFCPPPNA